MQRNKEFGFFTKPSILIKGYSVKNKVLRRGKIKTGAGGDGCVKKITGN
jgi:hypothetical protein